VWPWRGAIRGGSGLFAIDVLLEVARTLGLKLDDLTNSDAFDPHARVCGCIDRGYPAPLRKLRQILWLSPRLLR